MILIIYNIRIYTEALNEFDIMCQHINNIIATNYVNSAPNYGELDAELKRTSAQEMLMVTLSLCYIIKMHSQYTI